jgi:hypothetical protein
VDYAEKVPESGVAEIERLISSYPSQWIMALCARVRLLARQAGKTANLGILDEIVAALPKGEKGFLAQIGQLCAAVHDVATLQRRLDVIDRPVLRDCAAKAACLVNGNISSNFAAENLSRHPMTKPSRDLYVADCWSRNRLANGRCAYR